jgi:hypothetical protein
VLAPHRELQTQTQADDMRFEECVEGEYRIFVGALEAPRGDGYIAALIVNRLRGPQGRSTEAFRDESLACGYRWPTADEALAYAKARAREMVRTRSVALSC